MYRVLEETSNLKVRDMGQSRRGNHDSNPVLGLLKLVSVDYGAAGNKYTFSNYLSDETAECDRASKSNVHV